MHTRRGRPVVLNGARPRVSSAEEPGGGARVRGAGRRGLRLIGGRGAGGARRRIEHGPPRGPTAEAWAARDLARSRSAEQVWLVESAAFQIKLKRAAEADLRPDDAEQRELCHIARRWNARSTSLWPAAARLEGGESMRGYLGPSDTSWRTACVCGALPHQEARGLARLELGKSIGALHGFHRGCPRDPRPRL